MKKNIKPGMIVLDIGANIGFYASFLSELVGTKGKVFSFEPDETNFHFLKQNLKGRKNIVFYNFAVGPKPSKINLYLAKGFNMRHQTYDSGLGRKVKKIKSVSLDNFFGKTKIDFIKIDIEGFDYFAMLGAKNLIRSQKHLKIIGEIWPYGLKKAGASWGEYRMLLESYGLKVRLIQKIDIDKLEKFKNIQVTDFLAEK